MPPTKPLYTVLDDGEGVAVRFTQPLSTGLGLKMSLLVFAGSAGMHVAETAGLGELLPFLPLLFCMVLAIALPVLRGRPVACLSVQPRTVVFTGWIGDVWTASRGEHHFSLDGVLFERVPSTWLSSYELSGGPHADLRLREGMGAIHRVPLLWKEDEVRRLVRALPDLRARQAAGG